MARKGLTYARAGVHAARGDRLVETIAPLARSTARPEILASVGGFAALARLPAGYRDPLLVAGTDGVGTKILLARDLKRLDTVGIDLVAMSANDVLTAGAEPFLFLDYFATGRLRLKQARDLMRGVAAGCRMSGCALVGGETAEMPQLYRGDDFDLAGFCLGVVEASEVVDGRRVAAGDAILGLPSAGLHSNGYSLVRSIVRQKKLPLRARAAGLPETLGRELLRPTRIYVRQVLSLLERCPVHAMAHVTGGGIEGNLPRVLPRGTHAEIDRESWEIPALFRYLQAQGAVSEAEMFRTFNMGIGFVLVVPKSVSGEARRRLAGSVEIGRIVAGRGEPKVVWSRTRRGYSPGAPRAGSRPR